MNAQWESGKSKINISRDILARLVDSIEKQPNIEMAMRMYGHQSPVPPQDCDDTRLEVPFAKNNASRIRQKLWATSPKGTTPIARSLELSANDFPACSNCRNIIILITDGIESCDGDPCAVSLALQQNGVILKPFIIGIGLDLKTIDAFKCVGHFFNAGSEKKLEEILRNVLDLTVPTTVEVDLLDSYGKPTETNVNMTFYDRKTNEICYNYIHTMNEKGNPDTIMIDPAIEYRIEIHTIPPVEINKVKVVSGQHNILKKSAPQGFLTVEESRGNKLKGIPIIVRESDEFTTLHIQKIGQTEKYITGQYDLEILTLPRTFFYNVYINQSATTSLTIDEPGSVTFTMPTFGYASLYVRKEGDYKWIYNLNQVKRKTILLQPGKYLVVYRRENDTKTIHTVKKTFEIKSGFTKSVNF